MSGPWANQLVISRALEKVIKNVSGPAGPRATKIFVGGIPNKAARDELFALFARYGKIKDLSLPCKSKEENKGFAFITFESHEAVTAVFQDLKNVILRAKLVGLSA